MGKKMKMKKRSVGRDLDAYFRKSQTQQPILVLDSDEEDSGPHHADQIDSNDVCIVAKPKALEKQPVFELIDEEDFVGLPSESEHNQVDRRPQNNSLAGNPQAKPTVHETSRACKYCREKSESILWKCESCGGAAHAICADIDVSKSNWVCDDCGGTSHPITPRASLDPQLKSSRFSTKTTISAEVKKKTKKMVVAARPETPKFTSPSSSTTLGSTEPKKKTDKPRTMITPKTEMPKFKMPSLSSKKKYLSPTSFRGPSKRGAALVKEILNNNAMKTNNKTSKTMLPPHAMQRSVYLYTGPPPRKKTPTSSSHRKKRRVDHELAPIGGFENADDLANLTGMGDWEGVGTMGGGF